MRLLHTAFSILFVLIPAHLQAQEDSLNWLGDYQQALRVAKETRRPIFLEFRCEA